MKNKYTLLINYRIMNVGGIETYIYSLVKYVIEIGGRVIWFCDPIPKVSDSFRNLMMSEDVERIVTYSRGVHWFKHNIIKFDEDEQIVMVSFTPFEMTQAFIFKRKYSKYDINCFYAVAHYTGKSDYLEQYFNGFVKKYVHKRMKKIIYFWESNSNIRFFSQKHIETYECNYDIVVDNHESKLLKSVFSCEGFDYEKAIKRSERKQFNLITVGRFDFPHKGYILGLIRAYGKLKECYPQLTLTIIGYGKGETQVRNEIEKLTNKCKIDIVLTGEVSPDQLKYYFENSHMNISVAGAVGSGAELGVLSIPVRQYCYDCEAYGYLPNSRSMILSTDSGIAVEKFIEEAINMEQPKYIEMCKKSYDFYADRTVEPLYFFNTKNINKNIIMPYSDIIFIKILRIMCKVKIKLNLNLNNNRKK